MKKILYVLWVVIFVSCNNRAEKSSSFEDTYFESSNIEIEEIATEKEIISDDKDYNNATESFQFEELSQQKLQEMYDLINLTKTKSEFTESVKLQLKAYSNSIETTNVSGNVKIENLELKDEIVEVSDSIQKMKIYFDVLSNKKRIKDSVWAIITTKTIQFEGRDIQSQKIKFEIID